MIAELAALSRTHQPHRIAFSATAIAAFLLGVSCFAWAHLTFARQPFPGSPASHDLRLYPSQALGLALAAIAARQPSRSRTERGILLGAATWLVAGVTAGWTSADPVLAAAWTFALLVALCLLLVGVDRPALTTGMAVGVAASLPIMLFQAVAQTTWPAGTVQGWIGGELSPAVKGAAVLGQQRWLRPYGLTPHPNIAGGLAAVTCVLLAAAWLHQRRGWQLPLIGAAFAETLLSFSRSAWIGALLGLAALMLARPGGRRPLLLALALPTLLFAGSLGGLALARAQGSGSLEGDSLSQRVFLVHTAVRFWRQHPLVGIGPAQFSQAEVEAYGPSFIPEPVHNGVFLVLAESGIAGLAGAGLVAAGVAARIARQRDWDMVATSLAILPPLMFDHYLLTSAVGLILIAAGLAQAPRGSSSEPQKLIVGFEAQGVPACQPNS